jgi:membrane-bound lytic murein transglycosylase B
MVRKSLLLSVLLAGMAVAGSEPSAAQVAPVPTPVPAPVPAPVVLEFASSGDMAFDAWRAGFAQRAVAAGRSPAVVQRMLAGLRPDPRIVNQDQNQAEFVRPVWDYINRAVTPQKISEGAGLRAQHAQLFTAVERRFGVDADIIAAIWGVETNFGGFPLSYDAPQALATLAADGRRRGQFETYLIALMEMVERGFVGPDQMKGSWAGALGQPQFMPDVYLTTAVDWDGDGKRDIWTNQGDVFASIANYLASRGWKRSEPVYDEVLLPQDFDYALADGTSRPVSQWVSLGVRSASGFDYSAPIQGLTAQLYLPAGAKGPALILFPNFGVIRTYNPSDRYAMIVALLARGFEGGSGLVKSWPVEIGSLQRDELFELQTALNKLGYSAGTPDGMFGNNTRAAVRRFQQAERLPADGYPTPALLTRITNKVTGIDRAAAQSSAATLRTETSIRELQRALIRLNRLRGAADGEMGPATERAIESFERSLRLEPTGRATTFILAEARKAVSQLPPPRKAKKKRRR